MDYINSVQTICNYAISLCKVKNVDKLHFSPMRKRDDHVNTKRGFIIGRTNLRTGLITIDVFTPKFRKPKKIASILRTLAHEIAHHQKPPFRQCYRKKFIIRRHYPSFYKKVNKNIQIFKKDKILRKFFKSI